LQPENPVGDVAEHLFGDGLLDGAGQRGPGLGVGEADFLGRVGEGRLWRLRAAFS